jgi:hypothetical protein
MKRKMEIVKKQKSSKNRKSLNVWLQTANQMNWASHFTHWDIALIFKVTISDVPLVKLQFRNLS